MSSICVSAAPQPVSEFVLGAGGLPTRGCLCKSLPNIEKVLKPTGVRQKGILEPAVLSE